MLQRIHELGTVLISVGRVRLTAGRHDFLNAAAGELGSELSQRKDYKLRVRGAVAGQ